MGGQRSELRVRAFAIIPYRAEDHIVSFSIIVSRFPEANLPKVRQFNFPLDLKEVFVLEFISISVASREGLR
jgi:hypothetical protein